MDWKVDRNEVDRYIEKDEPIEDTPEVKQCPFRFSVGENIGYECIGEKCQLFTAARRCAIEVLASAQQSVQRTCFSCGGPVNTSTGYIICENGCGGPVTASR